MVEACSPIDSTAGQTLFGFGRPAVIRNDYSKSDENWKSVYMKKVSIRPCFLFLPGLISKQRLVGLGGTGGWIGGLLLLDLSAHLIELVHFAGR